MGKCVFPQIQLELLRLKAVRKGRGIRKALLVPFEGAGVCMRLPARFQSHHIAWNFAFAELSRELEGGVMGCARIHAVPETQSPLRRLMPTAGEYVVSPNCIQHGRPG